MRTIYAIILSLVVASLALVNTYYRSSGELRIFHRESYDSDESATGSSTPPSSVDMALLSRNSGRPQRSKQPYIVIDRYSNRLFLRTADTVLIDALCSTGSGGELADSLTGRYWKFETPAGVYTVHTKLENPWWRKPDWAFIEEGLPLPESDKERLDANMMGEYAIGFGDGYFVHGTIYERLLGAAVTHGCVRLGANDLREVYRRSYIGMRVYVF